MVALALLIGFASILSAVVAWRASLAAIESSRLQSLAVQEQAREQQLERQIEGWVAQDERFLVPFQEHALAARELQSQADEMRADDPALADALDLEAHSRLALARSVREFIRGTWVELGEDGTVDYDSAAVLRNMREGDTELRELRPEQTIALAQEADLRTMSLIGVAAVLVAALFFLTVAQVVHGRARVRLVFAGLGGTLVLVGAFAFVAIEVAV